MVFAAVVGLGIAVLSTLADGVLDTAEAVGNGMEGRFAGAGDESGAGPADAGGAAAQDGAEGAAGAGDAGASDSGSSDQGGGGDGGSAGSDPQPEPDSFWRRLLRALLGR